MENEHLDIDKFTFYDDSIVTSRQVLISHKSTIERNNRIKQINNKKYLGFLTQSGKSTIKKRLTAWLTAIKIYNLSQINTGKFRKHMPIFVTLTLSGKQIDDDKIIKRKLLEPFLKQLRYNNLYTHHFWKAERQKNDNIHFHIVFDKYIDKKELQKRWNSVQKKNGYLDLFEIKFNHLDAPSTHVKGISNMNRATNYVLKYVQKEKNETAIDGRVYTFSKCLALIKPFSIIDKYSDVNTINNFIENLSYNCYTSDFFCVDKVSENNYFQNLPVDIYSDYISYYLNLYKILYPDTSNNEILNAYLKLLKKRSPPEKKIKKT